MDAHQASISIAVRDAAGKLVMESLIETKAATILEFFQGLKGTLCVAFEEGTSAAWLYDLLKPHVANVIVCDPPKNALACVVAPSSSISNSTFCCGYAEKHGGSCYGKAGSIQPMSFSGRFPAWDRSEWPF